MAFSQRQTPPPPASLRRAKFSALLALAAGTSIAHICKAAPVGISAAQEEELSAADYYFRVAVCAVLVLTGGLLAGLTLGLMSLDETNLHILATSGTATQRKYAKRIQPLRKNGHWLLVTLLLGNTVINETLPIVMHSVLGGGVAAVLASTAAIVVFGEIIPQSLCARYGLAIGAFFAHPVRVLEWVLAPLGYPIAMLLDWALGAEHGIVYKRAELKELVSLSDTDHGGTLTRDEVTVIRGALELNEKLVLDVMTELRNVFMVDVDGVLDRRLMDEIVRRGHSRVPLYAGGRRENVVGVLLVKSLILVDPDDCVPVRDVSIARVPWVTPEIPLYDILNAFQEGGSHMAVVMGPPPAAEPASAASPLLGAQGTRRTSVPMSPPPLTRHKSGQIGGDTSVVSSVSEEALRSYRPVGIITLEDVIEELIQEEIIDETDVFVDMRKTIKVMRAVGGSLDQARLRGTAFSARRRQDMEALSDQDAP